MDSSVRTELNINTPKKIIHIKKDGGTMNLVWKHKVYYLETNRVKYTQEIKSLVFNYKLEVDEDDSFYKRSGKGDDLNAETIENINEKLSYLISERKKKNPNIDIVDNIGGGSNFTQTAYWHEITFKTKKGGFIVKKILCGKRHAEVMAQYLLKKNASKYESIEKIFITEQEKNFFEKIFSRRASSMKIGAADLLSLTSKMESILKNKDAPATDMLKSIISQLPVSPLKNSLIELKRDIDASRCALSEAMQRQPDNYPEVFVELVKLSEKQEAEAKLKTIHELYIFSERAFKLGGAVKKALMWPMLMIGFMFGIGVLLAFASVPMIKSLYQSMNAPVPGSTLLLETIVFGALNNWFVVLATTAFVWIMANFISKNTFFGMKWTHDFFLSVPLLGRFTMTKDLETLVTVLAMMYPVDGMFEGSIYKMAKKVVANYHIKGVLNTVSINAARYKIPAYETLQKYPQYVDVRIAGAIQNENKTDELNLYKRIFSTENDEFIERFPQAVKPILNGVIVGMLIFIIYATLLPIYGILQYIE